jgi:hypothetical protein
MEKQKIIEDELAASIAEGWAEIEKKAGAEKTEEARKSEATLLEWAAKLETILKGPPK